MRVNTARAPIHTHEGAKASHISPLLQLRRSVMACLLWEDQFYEDGQTIADRIKALAHQVPALDVASIAIEARDKMHLRHVSLLLARELARHPARNGVKVGEAVSRVIQRADELAEFLSIYWQDGKQPLSKQVKVGLARAFRKFDAYQLAKYNRNDAIKLRDVLFLCHAKPKDDAQAETWKQLVEGTLPTPDTWETNLSGGKDKGETFTRLLTENKLGYMALLRNLRNMQESGVPDELVKRSIVDGAEKSKALPFRFIAAVRAAPAFLGELDVAMQHAMTKMERLDGRTVICVDVSGSMSAPLSGKSTLNRRDAAAGLAILCRGISDARVIGFGTSAQEIPAYAGLALADKLAGFGGVVGHGTDIRAAVQTADLIGYDRLIVITDEQSATNVPAPNAKAYMINVASYKNGVGYGPWTHIDGFSENTVRFIQELEGS